MPTTEPTTEPTALVLLANLGRPRRPAGASAAHREPVLPDPATASRQLARLAAGPVADEEMADLRTLQQVATAAAEAILAGEDLGCAALNALAARSTARTELVADGAALRRRLVWTDPSMTAALARRLVDELGSLEPARLKRCARPECDLVFYDTTRSRTRRWHAEDPCGWRQRQRTHRAAPGDPSQPPGVRTRRER